VRVLRNIQKNDSPLNQSYTEFNSHIRYFILALRVRPLKSISYDIKRINSFKMKLEDTGHGVHEMITEKYEKIQSLEEKYVSLCFTL
jgi:hypothetical protein